MLHKFPKTFNQNITLEYEVDKPQSLGKRTIYIISIKKKKYKSDRA